MNQYFFSRFIALSLVTCHLSLSSCGGRNPNLSEKQLQALVADSIHPAKADEAAPALPDTGYIPPAGAKYRENRAVDPASPPVALKVSLQAGEKKPLRMSRLGSSVEYVTLWLPGEKDFFLSETSVHINGDHWAQSYGSNTRVSKLGDHFITSDELGIRLFDSKGVFVNNLLLSEFEGERNAQKVEIEFDGYHQAMLCDVLDNSCYLAKIDHSGKKVSVGEYNVSSAAHDLVMTPVRNYPSGMYMDRHTRFSFRGGMGQWPVAMSFSTMGDTLCKFTNHTRLAKGVKGIANSDQSFFYRDGGKLYFRQAYCDTIFRVASANRIVPVYRFDFGAQRVTLEEGVRAKTQNKFLPWKWMAFKNAMILIFTEGRDCPNCRKAGEVTFHCVLFDKQTGRAAAIDMNSRYPEEALIENDIDNGLPLPLDAIHIQNDGSFIATYTKKQIEEMLKSNPKIDPGVAEKLKAQAAGMQPNEMLTMIVR